MPKRLCSPLKFRALRAWALWSTNLSTRLRAAEGLFLQSSWEEMGATAKLLFHSMNDQVKEPSLPTYQTISAQLVLQGTSQLILMMEWLTVPCLHGEFFSCQKTPYSVMPFGQVLSRILAGKRGTGRGVQEGSAGPLSQAAGSWTSTLTAAPGTGLCPARLLRQCRHAES